MHVHNVIERAALISLSFSFSHMVIPASDGALGKYYGPVRRKVPVEFFVIVYPHLSRRGPVMIHQKALVSCQAPSSSSPVHRQAIKLHLYFSSESDRSCLPLRHWPVTIWTIHPCLSSFHAHDWLLWESPVETSSMLRCPAGHDTTIDKPP